jgi:hypothetical protein
MPRALVGKLTRAPRAAGAARGPHRRCEGDRARRDIPFGAYRAWGTGPVAVLGAWAVLRARGSMGPVLPRDPYCHGSIRVGPVAVSVPWQYGSRPSHGSRISHRPTHQMRALLFPAAAHAASQLDDGTHSPWSPIARPRAAHVRVRSRACSPAAVSPPRALLGARGFTRAQDGLGC